MDSLSILIALQLLPKFSFQGGPLFSETVSTAYCITNCFIIIIIIITFFSFIILVFITIDVYSTFEKLGIEISLAGS